MTKGYQQFPLINKEDLRWLHFIKWNVWYKISTILLRDGLLSQELNYKYKMKLNDPSHYEAIQDFIMDVRNIQDSDYATALLTHYIQKEFELWEWPPMI